MRELPGQGLGLYTLGEVDTVPEVKLVEKKRLQGKRGSWSVTRGGYQDRKANNVPIEPRHLGRGPQGWATTGGGNVHIQGGTQGETGMGLMAGREGQSARDISTKVTG